jgi:hypothetical protein
MEIRIETNFIPLFLVYHDLPNGVKLIRLIINTARRVAIVKKFLVPIVLLVCISLSGCIGMDPAAAIGVATLQSDLVLTRQVIIESKRGILFAFSRGYTEVVMLDGKTHTERKEIFYVKVKEVSIGSDAEKAGIKVGDEVLEVNDKAPEYYPGSVIDLFFASNSWPSTNAGTLERVQIKFKMKRGQHIYTVALESL